MISPIDKLVDEVWGYCVIQRAPKNEETLKRWQGDEFSRLKEGFVIHPLPLELSGLVQDAIKQWENIEKQVLDRLKMSREEFLIKFKELREDFLKQGKRWRPILFSLYPKVYGAVRNMEWVNLFSWMLPHAYREQMDQLQQIGRMVTALFYIEIIGRTDRFSGPDPLRRIEARWQMVDSEWTFPKS